MRPFLSFLLVNVSSVAATGCQTDTIHCSFRKLSDVVGNHRRLVDQPSVETFCVAEGNGTVNYQLNTDTDNSASYQLLKGLLVAEMVPMPPALYIREGKVVDASDVVYLVEETKDTRSVQWILAHGLDIFHRAVDTARTGDDYQIPVDTRWIATPKATAAGHALSSVTNGICPTPAPTHAPTPTPTPMPTPAPTPQHPCVSGDHDCDRTFGACVYGAGSDAAGAAKTRSTAHGHTYHCVCQGGYTFADGQDPTANACVATTAPTAAPTRSPTPSPTNAPTHAPTRQPTAAPTAFPTPFPTPSPTPHPCDDGSHGCDAGAGGICYQSDAGDSGWTCGCKNTYYCSAGCSAPHVGHTCTLITASPTPAPTTAPTAAPTLQPTTAPTLEHPCVSGDHVCDEASGAACVEGAGADAARGVTKSGHVYHCACAAGLAFAEPENPRNNTCVVAAKPTNSTELVVVGDTDALAGGAGVAAASAGGGVTAQTEVAAAAGAVVGAGLLVVGLAARRKRDDDEEEEDEEEVDAKRRKIVWSDSMERDTFVDDSDAKAKAREDALQVGLMMGAQMANRKAEENGGAGDLYRSSKMLGRLDDVRLDGDEDAGADADMPAWMMSGWVVDKKEIEYLSELGAGAFGAVSLVRVRGTLMAAKQLNPDADPARDVQRREELLREVKAMAELQHTNVVRIFGVCMDPGHTCVLMEFAQNGTVRDLLDKAQKEGAPLPAYAVFSLMRGVVLGMRHAHAHADRDGRDAPILHRDLKAANILLTENNSALVSDFGLATDGSEGDAGAGGTLAYSPPEVLQAMAGQSTGMVDADGNPNASGWSTAGDVYSFGVLAWELATGNVPYAGANARGLFQDVVHGGKRCHGGSFDALAAEGAVDPFFASIIERAWAQDRAARPTFKELSEEFERMAKEPRFQTPGDVYGDLDALMLHSSGRESEMRAALKDIDARVSGDVKVDVASLLAAEEDRRSAVAVAKEDGGAEAKNVLTETFANFYTDVFGNNKADDDDDDLEAMV